MSSESKLEKYSDRVLFLILKQIVEKCDEEGVDWKRANYNDEVSDIIEDSFRPFGIESNSYEDGDFIWSLLKNNLDVIGEEKLSKSLDRPVLKKYEFDVVVSETIYQSTYYTHKIESYSKSPYYLVKTMEEQGHFEYWEGNDTYRDVHDSETNEITIQTKFTEI
jgi:hypothetical protein